MDRAIQVTVAVHHVGEAIGVKDTQGILEMILREVQVSCLPGNIPEYLEADITNLAIHDVLTVKDLKVPEGVRILNDPNQAVVTVAPPMAEESGGGGRGDDGSDGGRAGSAHRAEAEGRGSRRGGREGQGRREEEVGGPGHRRPRQSGPGISRHASQRGPARRGRARPSHPHALRARGGHRWRRRAGTGEPLYLIKPGSLHERHRHPRWRASRASSTWAPPTSSSSSTTSISRSARSACG